MQTTADITTLHPHMGKMETQRGEPLPCRWPAEIPESGLWLPPLLQAGPLPSFWGMWKKCKLFIAACLISSLAGKFPSYLEQHWACNSHYGHWLLPWRCSQIEPVPVKQLGQWEGKSSSESSEGPDWKVRLLITGKGGKNNIYYTHIFLSLELFYFIELLWEWI